MALTGAQAKELCEALGDAYRKPYQLDHMLWFEGLTRLSNITGDGAMPKIVADVVDEAEREGWTAKLVEGAVGANPGNETLKAFYETTWLALSLPTPSRLEALVSPGGFFDLEPWIGRIVEIGRRVCRITVLAAPRPVYGTGFLVGPDLVLTNHHVLEPVLAGEREGMAGSGPRARTANVELRFDYKVLKDRAGINDGTVHRLKGATLADWLEAESPRSPLDDNPADGQEPGADQLDFVLARLAQRAGEDVLAELPDKPGRGWVDVPNPPPALVAGDGLLVAQHPDKEPIKLDLRDNAVVGVNGNGTRVTYVNNTLGGSSGSPCFLLDSELPLVALHHLGDPNFSQPKRNQGIPVAAIGAWLVANGLGDRLGPRWA